MSLTNNKIEYLDYIRCQISNILPYLPEQVCAFIACQSALETNFGRSRIAIENNNLFGMKLPYSRPTCAVGEQFEHARYISQQFSIVDYVLWITYHKPLRSQMNSIESYSHFLTVNHYCPSPRYIQSILDIYEQYKEK